MDIRFSNYSKEGELKPDGDAFVGEVAFGFGDGDFLEVEN